MSDKIFLDTNVLVYAVESHGEGGEKSSIALKLAASPNVVISTQVVGEFYRATTNRRRTTPLTHEQACAWVELWLKGDVRSVTTKEVEKALEIVDRHGVGYYDALILATAINAGCNKVASEDLNSGQDYGGVVVDNPFLGVQSHGH